VIFSPYWVGYAEIIKLAGGIPVLIEGNLEKQLQRLQSTQLKQQSLLRTKSGYLFVSFNPTGLFFSKSWKLEALLRKLKSIKTWWWLRMRSMSWKSNFAVKNYSIASFQICSNADELPSMDFPKATPWFVFGLAWRGWNISAHLYHCQAVEKRCKVNLPPEGTGTHSVPLWQVSQANQTPSKDMADA